MLRKSSGASRTLAVLLLLAPLTTLSLVVALATGQAAYALVAVVWGLLYLVVAVWAVVDAVIIFRRGDANALGASARLVKYAGIPFFTTNFVVLAAATGMTLLVSSLFAAGVITGALAVVAVPIMVVGTYLIMLPTSAWGIAGAVLLRRQGRAGTGFAVVHVILHLIFVLDILSSLLVAYRALPGPPKPLRMVGWIAGVVAMAVLVPTAIYAIDTPRRQEQERQTQQVVDAMAALPGVARVEDRTVELAPGITLAQVRAIAVRGYASQDNTSPADASRWTLTYGRASFVLKGVRPHDVPLRALLLVGPVPLDPTVGVIITGGLSPDDTSAFLRISGPGRGAITGRDGLGPLTAVVRGLAAADPETAAVVGGVATADYGVGGPRVRSARTADEIDAVETLLSDDVTLTDLRFDDTVSKVVIAVPDESRIAPTCRSGLAALGALPDLQLAVHTDLTRSRNAEPC